MPCPEVRRSFSVYCMLACKAKDLVVHLLPCRRTGACKFAPAAHLLQPGFRVLADGRPRGARAAAAGGRRAVQRVHVRRRPLPLRRADARHPHAAAPVRAAPAAAHAAGRRAEAARAGRRRRGAHPRTERVPTLIPGLRRCCKASSMPGLCIKPSSSLGGAITLFRLKCRV